MTKRLFGSLLVAGMLALLLFGASVLLFSGSTQAQSQSPTLSSVAANGAAQVAAQGNTKGDAPLGVWTTVAPFPTITISPTPGSYPLKLKRAGATGYFPNGKLYVLGGRHGVDGEDSSLSSIYEFTPGNPGSWLRKNGQIDPGSQGSIYSSNMAVVTLTDTTGVRIYAIGGSSVNSQPISTTRVYDPVADSVTILTTDPWPANPIHIPGGYAVYNNKLYIFGGYSSIGTPTVFNETWRFDPMAAAGSKWTQIATATLSQARGFIAGAALDGYIYAIGGDMLVSGTLTPVTTVERMDPNAGSPTWTAMAGLPTAKGDMGAWAYDTGTNYEISGRIAVAGGVFPTPVATGFLYNPGTNSWGSFPSLVNATRNYGSAQLNGFLYAFGGYDYSGGIPSGANFNQRYDATTPIGTPTPTSTGTQPTATRTNTAAPATSTGTATPTICSSNYGVATATGTIITGTSDTGNHCDDCSTSVSLPFAYTLYDQSFNSVLVGSNGYMSFGTPDDTFTTTCMPTGTHTYSIFPFWVDQTTGAPNKGIFTTVTGTAPNRVFNIEWRNCQYNTATSCLPNSDSNYEVQLLEGQSAFRIIYGTMGAANNGSGTVGVQKTSAAGQFTQYSCDAGAVSGSMLLFTAGACGSTTPTPVPPTATATATSIPPSPTPAGTPTCTPAGAIVDVGIQDFLFNPQNVTIAAGTTIRWTNNGSATHTSTSDTAVWDSGNISSGGQFSFTFNTPGVFPYHCAIHTFMTGTITVVAANPCATNTVPVPPTATRTNTSVPPTATRTNTAVPPTATRTNTPVVPPTATRTNTAIPPSVTVVPSNTSEASATSTTESTAVSTSTPEATAAATSTTCPIAFTDVLPTDEFYPFIRCLACRGIASGYEDGTFKPFNNITRGQIAKIVSNAAGYDDVILDTQTFSDVISSNPFYVWIERVYIHGTITGYPCGGVDVCDNEARPYFHPFSDSTRGQLSKIVALAAGIQDPVPPDQKTYADVQTDSTFWLYIEQLTGRGVMGGYVCGGVNPDTGAPEPCDTENRPYFRPDNHVTRAQSAKIVANTFYPNCQTPSR